MKRRASYALSIVALLVLLTSTIPVTAVDDGAVTDGLGHKALATVQAQLSSDIYIPLMMQASTPRETHFTILHTNDFHGYLESDSYGRGGSAYMAGAVQDIRDEVGEENVLLMDAGDIYFGGAPISGLLMGESAIDVYNLMGYDVAAYGNHEFDRGQTVTISRTMQSEFPWIGANIVISGTEWDNPAWIDPYVTMTVGAPANSIVLGVIGIDTDQTPLITLKGVTDGLVFRDPTETVLHYYDEVKAQSDAMIVLAHMGTDDTGSYIGLETMAQELIDAGKPIDLMIGGHQHEPLFDPVVVGPTHIIEAGFFGRWLGRADVVVSPGTKTLTLERYRLITINDDLTPHPDIEARVAYWADQVAPVIEQTIGTIGVSLVRNYNAESSMGNLVTDAMLWQADSYDDGEVNNSVQVALTNPGGLRADIGIPITATVPYPITWGDTYRVLPFGNTQYLMDLTGEQLQTIFNQSASLYKGIMQTAGATWRWYNDCQCDAPTSWGATDIMIGGEPLDPEATYRIVTNNFLAGGQDGWLTFADGTNRVDTCYDQQEALNDYIRYYNETVGPIDHEVEGRIEYYVP